MTLGAFTNTSILVFITMLTIGGCRNVGTEKNRDDRQTARPVSKAATSMVTCPVCGLEFPKAESVGSVTHHETTYFFYLKDHLSAFKKKPDDFLTPEKKSDSSADSEKSADTH